MLNLSLSCLQADEQIVRCILFHLQVLAEKFDLRVRLTRRVSGLLELPEEVGDLLLECHLFLLVELWSGAFFGLILFELFSDSLPVF